MDNTTKPRITKTLRLSASYVSMLGKEESKKEVMKPYEGYNPEVISMYYDNDSKYIAFDVEFDSLDH